MKRTRYDAEYERVRRETEAKQRREAALAPAAAPAPRRPSPREEERQRVGDIADEVRENLEHQEAELREQQRVSSAANAESARAFNERAIRAEYSARGLRPPVGTLVSLDTLLFTGWTIAEVMGRAELVPPSKDPPHERRQRQDYDQNT
jgi:hypothetical protein